MSTIRSLFRISRPISWVNTAYPFAATYMLGSGQLDLTFWLGSLYFLIPYNLLMYGINDVYDYESDLRNPRKGGVEGAVEAKAFHPTIIKAAILSNAPFLAALMVLGTPLSNLILLAVVFLVIAYSLPPLRFKERPLIDSVTSSLHFVGPLLFALSIVGFTTTGLIAAGSFLLWGIASHILGAVQDILPDRAAHIHSVATFLGARTAVRLALVTYAAASGLLLWHGGLAAVAGIVLLVYTLNVTPYWSIDDAHSGTVNRAWKRFLWLNYVVGFIITLIIIIAALTR